MLKQRSFWGYIGLCIITFGIYGLVFVYKMTSDINTLTAAESAETSPGLALVLYMFTGGIYPLIWYYQQGQKLYDSGMAKGVAVKEKGSSYLLWIILGAFLIGLGPLIALAKFIKNYNSLVLIYNNKVVTGANA
ncbi:DUF4234 domain-containing protein [Ruminiclostridium cellobioparum]|jgi:hypothetical protein|uniref:DUF4234 domain-containing protein n=1 Tax=Ruminiclostridium cellobioparum TaxID=29355 RepID=UPI000684DFC8|nr:DUF4234 domain-containing protein [Ruminiclostridium cellobioparum]